MGQTLTEAKLGDVITMRVDRSRDALGTLQFSMTVVAGTQTASNEPIKAYTFDVFKDLGLTAGQIATLKTLLQNAVDLLAARLGVTSS